MSKRAGPTDSPSSKRAKEEPSSDSLATSMPPPSAAGARAAPSGASKPGPDGKNSQAATSSKDSGPSQSLDPEELSDALHSAGVDLREEENLLSSTLSAGTSGANQARHHAPRNTDDMFLDYKRVQSMVAKLTAEQGLKFTAVDQQDAQLQDPLALLSASCEEWIAEILTGAAIYSRHRRLARNPTNLSEASKVSKALRQITIKEKKAEEERQAFKLDHGIGESADAAGGVGGAKSKKAQMENDETQHRAANDTARMMTQGRKKFSWLQGNSTGPSRGLAGSRRQAADPARFKEIKEEQGIVLRDLLAAIEDKHMGVRRALIKGYTRYN